MFLCLQKCFYLKLCGGIKMMIENTAFKLPASQREREKK